MGRAIGREKLDDSGATSTVKIEHVERGSRAAVVCQDGRAEGRSDRPRAAARWPGGPTAGPSVLAGVGRPATPSMLPF